MITTSTLNIWADSWLTFLASSLVDAAVVLFAVSILWLLIHKKVSAQLGYSLFLLVLVKLFIPFEITVPAWVADYSPGYSVNRAVSRAANESGLTSFLSFQPEVAIAGNLQEESATTGSTAIREPFAPLADRIHSASAVPLKFSAMLMIGWITIVLFLLIWFIAVQWKTRRILLNSSTSDTASLPVDFQQLKELAGVRRRVTLLSNPQMSLPATWGILRPRLIIPADLASSVTPEQLKWILLHELAHIRRSDLAVTLFQRLLQILFFFNPAVWIANWVADQLREYACDDLALSICNTERKVCGKGFLSLLERVNNLPTVMTAPLGMLNYNTVIKRRLVRILDARRKLRVGFSAGAIAILLPFALVFLPSLRAEEETALVAETFEGNSDTTAFQKIRIPANPGNGVLSPDGTTLAFTSEGSLWTVPVSGKVRPDLAGEAVRLTDSIDAFNYSNTLTWSADGKWIAFNVVNNNENSIYTVASSGGAPKKVIDKLARGVSTYQFRIALSPNGKTLVFTAEDSSEPQGNPTQLGRFCLYTISVEGGEPSKLTDSHSSEPAFSPDGRWISYIKRQRNESKDNTVGELWAVPADGGESIQVTKFNGRVRGPVWSPDGTKIALGYESVGNTSNAIWIVPFNETGPSSDPLTKIRLPGETFDLMSGWTSGNQLGLFVLSPSHHAVYTVPSSGGKATQITPSGMPFHPRWSPDGERIFFRWGYGRIASVPAEGGKVETVPYENDPGIIEAVPGGGNLIEAVPGGGNHISPDGSTILFVGGRLGTNPVETGLWMVPISGGEPRQVPLDISGEIRYSSWSPDGLLIGFLNSREESNKDWSHQICVVDENGIEIRQLTTPQDQVAYSNFAWSPNGMWIAYFSSEKEIRLLDLTGGENRVVAKVDSVHFHKEMCWSPDSSEIAYSAPGRIMVVPINGGDPREVETGVLTKKVNNIHLDWSPDGKKLAFSAQLGQDPEFWFVEGFLP